MSFSIAVVSNCSDFVLGYDVDAGINVENLYYCLSFPFEFSCFDEDMITLVECCFNCILNKWHSKLC